MKNKLLKYSLVCAMTLIASLPAIAVGQSYWPYPDSTPPWVTRWAVTDVTPFTATINWTTDERASAMVEFCTTWAHCNNFTPMVTELTNDHVINLSGLLPYTRYYFYMISTDQFGNRSTYGYWTLNTAWNAPVTTPTPLPTPAPTVSPYPTPFPSQTPLPSPDVIPPWPTKWSVTNITPFSATVNWTTNELSDSKVEFCTSWVHCGNFTPLVSTPTTEHQINLSGLNSYTRYFFYMYSRDSSGNLLTWGYKTFTTAWVPPVILPTPIPTPVVVTPTPTPYPSQSPIATPDVMPPWFSRTTISNITTTSAKVEWITNEASDGMVEICTSWVHCANFTVRTNDNSTYHSADLTGLTAGRRYFYWMYSRDNFGNVGTYGYRTFNTASF